MDSSDVFSIQVDKQLSERPISPLIYGNFVELGLGREADGMWGQMLYNRSFENIPPYTYILTEITPEECKPGGDWWHSGYEEQPWFTIDSEGKKDIATDRFANYWGFYHGKNSASVSSETATTYGIGQDRLWLRKGNTYSFRGFIAHNFGDTENPKQKVTIKLVAEGDESKVIDSFQCEIGSFFKECNATLRNRDYTGWAGIRIECDAPGTLTVDGCELFPSDTINGWRKDVVIAMKKVRPAILRFPGGCFTSFYDWRSGVGLRDERMPVRSEYWGGLEYNDIGTDEYLDLCDEVGCEPFLVVNLMTGNAKLAADWVEYCNGSDKTSMGKWRAKNGHKAPRKVTYWELDNEMGRKFGPEQYAKRVVEFAKAMKAVDPNIKLVIVGYGSYSSELLKILNICGKYIDFVTDRSYEESDMHRNVANLTAYYKETGKRIGLCNTEWLGPTDAPPSGGEECDIKTRYRLQRWFYAMNTATILQRYWRNAEWFDFSNFNNLVNTWGLNVIESSKSDAWISCAGRVFEFYSGSKASWPVEVTPTKQDDLIHIGAAWTATKEDLVVNIINMGKETTVNIALQGQESNWSVRSTRGIAAEALVSRNTEDAKDSVKQVKPGAEVIGSKLTVDLPAYSICEVVLNRSSTLSF